MILEEGYVVNLFKKGSMCNELWFYNLIIVKKILDILIKVISLYLGPTICYDGINHYDLEPVKAVDAKPESDVLFEVSPNAAKEQIVDITVSGLPESSLPDILVPSDDLKEVNFLI